MKREKERKGKNRPRKEHHIFLSDDPTEFTDNRDLLLDSKHRNANIADTVQVLLTLDTYLSFP
jgi:hypothetical protein